MPNSTPTEPDYRALLEALVEKEVSPKSLEVAYRYVADPDNLTQPGSLLTILNVKDEDISDVARSTIELIEGTHTDSSDWTDFKWKLAALENLVDVFDSALFEDTGTDDIFQLWYFYFEGRHSLAESILCGLNGYYSASKALLRVFLEFNLLQLYYYNVTKERQTHRPLQQYFERRIAPAWNTMVNKAVPGNSFCRPVRARLHLHLKGLSRSAAHAYHPDVSPRQYSGFSPGPSLEGTFFWMEIGLVLQSVLWAYYVNFPTLFHPRDIVKKFGFNSPVGLFVDHSCAAFVKRSLTSDEYKDFHEYASQSDDTLGLLEWYDSRPDLSEFEIRASWDSEEYGELGDITAGYCQQMARKRATTEVMALRPGVDLDGVEIPEEGFAWLNYDNWKKVYKKVK